MTLKDPRCLNCLWVSRNDLRSVCGPCFAKGVRVTGFVAKVPTGDCCTQTMTLEEALAEVKRMRPVFDAAESLYATYTTPQMKNKPLADAHRALILAVRRLKLGPA